MRRHAVLAIVAALTPLLAGCGTTTVTYVTPWLRSISHKEASWDSGGRVHRSLEVRRRHGWNELRGFEEGVALDGGRRVAVRSADGLVAIVADDGVLLWLLSCAHRGAIVSPDRRRVVCFERELHPIGFLGEVLVARGEAERADHTQFCRLVSVHPNGEARETEVAPFTPGCLPENWGSRIEEQVIRGFEL